MKGGSRLADTPIVQFCETGQTRVQTDGLTLGLPQAPDPTTV
jgi:hypothetical protein